ncbi:MAG: hypothetical protein ACP5KY_02535 [Thermoproteus sp.]
MPPYVSVPTALLSLSVVLTTYFAIRAKWDEKGLLNFVEPLGKGVSKAFLVTWVVSYYLYVVYTSVYAPCYSLGLDGLQAMAVTLLVSASAFFVTELKNPLYAFPTSPPASPGLAGRPVILREICMNPAKNRPRRGGV